MYHYKISFIIFLLRLAYLLVFPHNYVKPSIPGTIFVANLYSCQAYFAYSRTTPCHCSIWQHQSINLYFTLYMTVKFSFLVMVNISAFGCQPTTLSHLVLLLCKIATIMMTMASSKIVKI